jgi:hypothetical protein
MVPATFDFRLANLNRDASSAGTSIPRESLNPKDPVDQSIVGLALLAGSTVKTWSYLFLK